jgi:CheY-like chemotaxis protein
MRKSTKKILVVEDNDDCRELLALFVRHLGYKVYEAATGIEAIDRASAVRPDLVMMDLHLPGMDGNETTARLKMNPCTKDIPVVINTAYTAGSYAKDAFDAGAAAVLHKPLDLTTLRVVLRKYLSAKTKQRDLSKDPRFVHRLAPLLPTFQHHVEHRRLFPSMVANRRKPS